MSSSTKRPYVSEGQMLDRAPLPVRIVNFAHAVYMFLGLYVVSLFAVNPYASAEQSSFNVTRPRLSQGGPRFGGGGGGGDDRRGPGGGGPGKRVGRVDDIRGPECKSCQ
ncbi:hypothetical protein FQN57_004904 [Myotisia sp. PD_48]|nr:hypothetical protein FQN57_004904 [Myotisia sp. PD_48]